MAPRVRTPIPTSEESDAPSCSDRPQYNSKSGQFGAPGKARRRQSCSTSRRFPKVAALDSNKRAAQSARKSAFDKSYSPECVGP